jgi:hypothetical protein
VNTRQLPWYTRSNPASEFEIVSIGYHHASASGNGRVSIPTPTYVLPERIDATAAATPPASCAVRSPSSS